MPPTPSPPLPPEPPRLPAGIVLRAGREADLPALREIERAAGAPFRSLGMAPVADDEPPTLAELRRYAADGGLLVAAGPDPSPPGPAGPAAYLLAEPLDGCLHIEQVSVHPDHSRQGLGRALIDRLAGRAAARRTPALTLTAFAEVPWNAPYYARCCGFRQLAEDELTEGLRRVRAREAAAGLDRWPRVCMRRALDPGTRPAPGG